MTFFTEPAGQGGVRMFSSRPRLEDPNIGTFQNCEIRLPNTVKEIPNTRSPVLLVLGLLCGPGLSTNHQRKYNGTLMKTSE